MPFTAPNLPLEDVLREVIRSEAEPDYATLEKWRRRYPQYEMSLIRFFSKWQAKECADERLPIDSQGQPPSVIAKQYALRYMLTKGRIPQPDDIPTLEDFDRLVLTAIHEFHGRGRRSDIIAKVAELAGLRVVPRSVLVSVRRLEERGLIWSWFDGRRTFRKRRGTKFFGITLAGGRALGTPDVPNPPREPEEPDDDEGPPRSEDLEMLLDEIELEVEIPSYDAVVKMCGRHPQYTKQLTDWFLKWAIQNIRDDEPQRLAEVTQEERLSDLLDRRNGDAESYVLEIMARQNRSMPPILVTSLDNFDRYVLEAVYKLRGAGDLTAINRRVSELAGVPVLPASISVSMIRLENFGLIWRRPWFIRGDWSVKITTGGKQFLAKTQ